MFKGGKCNYRPFKIPSVYKTADYVKSLSELSYQTETHRNISHSRSCFSASLMDTISPIKTILGIYRFSRLCSTFSGHAGAWTRTLELILKRELAVWGEALCLSVLRGLTWPQVQVRLSLAVNSVAWRVCVSHSKVSSRKTYRNPFNFTQIKRRNCDLEVLVSD